MDIIKYFISLVSFSSFDAIRKWFEKTCSTVYRIENWNKIVTTRSTRANNIVLYWFWGLEFTQLVVNGSGL